ncbi:hypothetical protein [Xenorhabdus bovienii]|uniref:hypothetical protein n=1 Tax=Xenorhabdus bovienii TaxID=40576 RepID=UPI0023B21245|nr:hypothetical protein [Xenorhabdus bovienii]MDE9483455.1 hypothetical protein [Xenorhabdus bovienii]
MSNDIIVSTRSGSDVIIGQELHLTITLHSDYEINSNSSISLVNLHNVSKSGDISKPNGQPGTFKVVLQVDSFIQDGDLVTFDILPDSNAVGFNKSSIQYKARILNDKTLPIYFKNDFLNFSHRNDDSPTGAYSKAITVLKDNNGNVLSGVPVAILEEDHLSFDKVDIYAADNQTKINVENISSTHRGFYVNTNDKGWLEFYIYPKQNYSLLFKVNSTIFGVTHSIPSKNGIYIIHMHNQGLDDRLGQPMIKDYEYGSPLVSTTPKFSVKVPFYNDSAKGDVILFFVNNKYINQNFTLESNYDLDKFSIEIPYDIFPIQERVTFSYWIINAAYNKSYMSDVLDVYYQGGANNQPPPVTERKYDLCTVYNSEGTDDPKNIIEDGNLVNCVSIHHYKHNEDNAGLFVEIKGTSDPYDVQTKPPFGSTVNLNLHVNADCKSVFHTFTQVMPSEPDQPGGNTATLTFGIPFHYLAHCPQFTDGVLGNIEFDYEVDNEDVKTYGKIWRGGISTQPSGATDCGDYD